MIIVDWVVHYLTGGSPQHNGEGINDPLYPKNVIKLYR